jgi:hypothetical protein
VSSVGLEEKSIKYKDVLKDFEVYLSKIDINSLRVQEMLYILKSDEMEEFLSLFNSVKLPHHYFSSKDLIREKLEEKFDIKSNDKIFFLDDGVYIKFFMQIESENTEDRRACGIAPEVLEGYKQEYFAHDLYKEEVFSTISLIVEDILNFRKINPSEFKRLFISTFVNMVEIIVIKNMDINDIKMIRGMSLYLLRELFDEILYYISDDILFHFANKDKKAEEFLSCFSVHETIDKKGIRHKPNPILDEGNHAWNMTTIRSTMMQHKKAKQAVYEKKASLSLIKKKFVSHKDDQIQFLKLKKEYEIKYEELVKSLENIQKTITKVQNVDSEKVKFIEHSIEKTFDKKPLIVKLLKKEDEMITQRNIYKKNMEECDLKISNKQKDIDIWERKYTEGKELLATIEKVGHPTDKQYDSIKKALAKTLVKR